MRHLVTLPRRDHAERFQDFLIARGKKCSLDDDATGTAIWVHDDDDMPFAKTELEKFQASPDAEEYLIARQQADARLKELVAQRKAARRNTVNLSQRWNSRSSGDCPITIGVIILCVFVFADTWVTGNQRGLRELLFFSTDSTWSAIEGGQYWRIVTPAIMHGGPLHILFNLMWWWQLGGMIERRKGSAALFGMALLIAAVSNTMQFQFGGPWFLGLSGVVFGVFGYVWVKGQLDPSDGIGIDQQSALWMLVWFAICWFSNMGLANLAHWGGLLVGVTLGAIDAGWRNWRRR
ncbi:rhomboid family intramembrane serine protease [bacterium]|nr:rhomboid family intramembrane serine protease [bacterium]